MTELPTLASININITSFLRSSNNLTQDRRAYLLNINNRINEMYEKNRDFGVSKINSLNQNAIMKEYSLYLQRTITDLLMSLKALKNHLIQEKDEQKGSTDKAYNDLITTIYENTQGMIDAMNTIVKKDAGGSAPLDEISSSYNNSSALIEIFGGRYQPFSQETDPFAGMEKKDELLRKVDGNCYGYVKSWANDVASNGLMTLMPRLDYKTLCEQKSQDSNFFKQTRSRLSGIFFPWAADVGITTDFPFLFNKLLSSLSHTQIYGLSFRFNSKPGHIIGIRFIAQQKEYEIFDPNVGISVFSTKKHAQDWLVFYFFCKFQQHYIKDNTINGSLILKPIASQPLEANPSIPTFETNDSRLDAMANSYLRNSKWSDNYRLRDAGFWEKNRDTFKAIFLLYQIGICATLGVLALAMFLLALSGVTSVVVIACVLSGPLIPAFALGLGLAMYAAYKLVDQHRYANSFGFFTKHGNKPRQSFTEDETPYSIPNLSTVAITLIFN